MKAAHGVRTVEVVRRVAPHLDAEAETRKIELREAAATNMYSAMAGGGRVGELHSEVPVVRGYVGHALPG